MNTSSGPSLFDNTKPDSSHRRTFINPTLWFDDCDGYRVVFCRHEGLYRVALGDPLHLALVAVTLRQSGSATQIEIAAAFGHSVTIQTVQRPAAPVLTDERKQPVLDLVPLARPR